MKKLFFIVAAMFVAVSFSACSDDDDNGGEAPTPEKWVKQIKYYFDGDYSETTNITYDSENRVKKIDDFWGVDYEFTYNGNSLTVKGRDEYEYIDEDMTFVCYVCKLNSDGYITEIEETGYETNGTDYYKLEYKNGYLQRVEKRYGDNNSRLGVTECKWSNGNLVESKYTDDDYRDDSHSYEVVKWSYSETATPINVNVAYLIRGVGDVPNILGRFGFCGRQSAKLVCEYDYTSYVDGIEDDSGHNSYGYTFNPDGTVKSMNRNGNSFLNLIY